MRPSAEIAVGRTKLQSPGAIHALPSRRRAISSGLAIRWTKLTATIPSGFDQAALRPRFTLASRRRAKKACTSAASASAALDTLPEAPST